MLVTLLSFLKIDTIKFKIIITRLKIKIKPNKIPIKASIGINTNSKNKNNKRLSIVFSKNKEFILNLCAII